MLFFILLYYYSGTTRNLILSWKYFYAYLGNIIVSFIIIICVIFGISDNWNMFVFAQFSFCVLAVAIIFF